MAMRRNPRTERATKVATTNPSKSPWLTNLFHPLMIGGMFGCTAISLVGLVHLVFPAWNGTYVIVGCVLAALEANYSYRLIRSRRLQGGEVLRFQVVEIALLFIALKIGGYVGDRWADVWADVQTWSHNPSGIADPATIVAFILAALSWWVSTQTTRDLERLGEPPEHSRYYVLPRESLTQRFFWGGVLLLVITGLHYTGIVQLLDPSRPRVPGPTINVLVYFLLELVMLGQIEFTQLRNQWQAQKITIPGELTSRWVRYSLVLLGLAAFLAFLLPTGYTVGLLDVAGGGLRLIVGILSLIAQILLFLLTLLLWPLMFLLSLIFGTAPPRLRPQSLSLRQQQEPLGNAAPGGWFGVLRSVLFWAATLGMLFYVVRNYLRDHPELLKSLAGLSLIRTLRRWWAALWRRLTGLAEALGERLPGRRSPGEGGLQTPVGPFHFLRLSALSARERILYYYLSVLRRAERQGLPRRRTQTPYEYDATLSPNLPSAQQELASLTQAFVEARYSPHTVDARQTRQVHTYWQQVKAALRALRDGKGGKRAL